MMNPMMKNEPVGTLTNPAGTTTAASTGSARQRLRSLIGSYLCVLVAVFLLFGPYLAHFTDSWTRYYMLWQRRLAWQVLGCMFLLALAWVVVRACLGWFRRPWLTRAYDHTLVLGLLGGGLTNVVFYTQRPVGYHPAQWGMEVMTCWVLLFGVVGYSLAKPTSKLVPRVQRIGLALSPMVLILTFHMLYLRSFPGGFDALPGPAAHAQFLTADQDDPPRPIYVFFFDEWSYHRTFQEGALRPGFPHMVDLAQQSIVCHNARSAGPCTVESIPRFLYQTDLKVALQDGTVGFCRPNDPSAYRASLWEYDGEFVPTRELHSVFSLVAGRDYHTVMVGFGHPFRSWLGNQVGCCRTYCFEYASPNNSSPLAEFRRHLFKASRYWTDPWSKFVHGKYRVVARKARCLSGFQTMEHELIEFLGASPHNVFAVIHYPAPHSPWLFDRAKGTYRAPEMISERYDNLEGYQDNLALLDHNIGQFTAALKRAGRFDDALVIMTSDHSWRHDPDHLSGRITGSLTHVPLFIKLPGQQRRFDVTDCVESRTLQPLIEYALNMRRVPGEVERGVQLARGSAETVPPRISLASPNAVGRRGAAAVPAVVGDPES